MYKIAFVIPWYGEGIPGGAEMELREVAGHLQKAGVEVEVLTTCVKDFTADWNQNYYAAGVAMVYDVPTRRFPVRKRDTATFDRINAQLMQGKHITPKEEVLFLQEMVNSPQLYEYIETHNDNYDLFVFMPYMFGTDVPRCVSLSGKGSYDSVFPRRSLCTFAAVPANLYQYSGNDFQFCSGNAAGKPPV